MFEPLYAALVATGALRAVTEALSSCAPRTLAGTLCSALRARADPTVPDRSSPAVAVVDAAAKLNLVPGKDLFNSVESWIELLGSRAFGGQGLRDLQSWCITQYGTCSARDCLRNGTGRIQIRPTCLFVSAAKVRTRTLSLDALISQALTNNFASNGRCGMAWQCNEGLVECKGKVCYSPADPDSPQIESCPEIMWVSPLFTEERCAVLETINGTVSVTEHWQADPIYYKLVGATYLGSSHYGSYVRFGDRWFYISTSVLHPTQFDVNSIPLRVKVERVTADLKLLVFVRLPPVLAPPESPLSAPAPPPSSLTPFSAGPAAATQSLDQVTATAPPAEWVLPDIQPTGAIRHYVAPIPNGPDAALIFSNNMCHLLQGWFEPVYAVAEHLGIVDSCISEQPRSLFHRALQNCFDIRKRAHSATEHERWLAPLQMWQAALRRERKEVPWVASFGQMGSCIPWYRFLAVEDMVGSFLHAAFRIDTLRKGQCTNSWCVRNYEVRESCSSLPTGSSPKCQLLSNKLKWLAGDRGLRLSCVECERGTSGFETQIRGLGEAVVIVVEERLLAQEFSWTDAEETEFGTYEPIALAVLKSDHYSSRLKVSGVWKSYSHHRRERWQSSTPLHPNEFVQAIIYCKVHK